MAIDGLISNRNFGAFVGSGKVYRKQSVSSQQRGDIELYAQGNSIFYRQTPCPVASGLTSGHTSSALVQAAVLFDEVLHEESAEGFISSSGSVVNCLRPTKGQQVKVNATCAYYKLSEEYEITEPAIDSLQPADGVGEAVLVEENAQETSSWWESFPKRWVIVLLCFTAFLPCNMDRVNMSIPILPMSQASNWDSATVGLIQSSFFWGYLLTQIVGGIWADKIGGKLVLGFGVVWWSIATVLTPIAARIGPPFLLMMRAFMGIGSSIGTIKYCSASVFGTAATGYILQRGSWDDVFKVAIILYIVGTLVSNLYSTGEKVLD